VNDLLLQKKIRIAYFNTYDNGIKNKLIELLRKTVIESVPTNCHTFSTSILGTANYQGIIKDASFMNIYYNFGDYILRPLLKEKYMHLLTQIYNINYTFVQYKQYNKYKIKYDIDKITGFNAKIPIYDEQQDHWGDDTFGKTN